MKSTMGKARSEARLAAFALLAAMAVMGAHSAPLRTAAQENAPKYQIGLDGKMTGICVEIMEAISVIDPGLVFSGQESFIPLRRIEQDLASGGIDVFFGFAKTKEKEALYRYIDLPLYSVKKVLAARKTDAVSIGSFEDVKKLADGIVLAAAGTASAEQAKSLGVKVDDGAATPEANLAKLVHGRGRFYFHTDIAISEAAKRAGLADGIKILPFVYSEEGQYLAVSKSLPEPIFSRLEKALHAIAANGALARIFSKYVGH